MIKMRKRKAGGREKHPQPKKRHADYWREKTKSKRRNVKRTPGKTKKFIKGAGTKVWVGKDVTYSGWMSEKKFKEMKKR